MFDGRGILRRRIRIDPARRVVVALGMWPAMFDQAHPEARTRLMAAIEATVDARPRDAT